MRYAHEVFTLALVVVVGCGDGTTRDDADVVSDAHADVAPPDADPTETHLDASELDPALVGCGCDASTASCALPGVADAGDEAGAKAAGYLLETCANLDAIAGFTIALSGHYRIDQGIVLPPGAKLVGGQALALDENGRPAMNEEGPAGCEGWGHVRCWEPVLAPGAVPTVIDATGLCSDGECGATAVITLQAGSELRRFTLRQDAAPSLASGWPSSADGISLAGQDALVSEVDVVGADSALRVAPCHEHDTTFDTDGAPGCAVPFTTGARVASSVLRYPSFFAASVIGCAAYDVTCFDGASFDAAFDGNVFLGAQAYSLFMRVWRGTDDMSLDVTTSHNLFVANNSAVASMETRYGGDRNTLTWHSRGDVLQANVGGVNIAACGDSTGAYCNDNSVTARFEGLVVRGSLEAAVDVGGGAMSSGGDLHRGNRARATLADVDVDGFVSCWGNDAWNEGVYDGSAASILTDNLIGLGYVPVQCTADRNDAGPAFVDRWLVLGMYDGRDAALEEALPDLLADGDHVLDTFTPVEGDVLGLPLHGEYLGPGAVPMVGRIDARRGRDATTADLDAWFRAACKPPGELWWGCAPGTHDDWLPPGNAAAYLFTYIENLSGGPLPVELAVAGDDRVVIWLRGLVAPGPAQTFELDRAWLGGPGTLHHRLPATLPAGRSLLTMLVVERDGDWGARLSLLDPATGRALETEGLVRHALSPTGFDPPPPEVKVYGCDANVGDFTGEDFDEPGALLGLSAMVPGSFPQESFEARLVARDPEMPTTAYAAETYDAIVVTALAAEIARSHVGADIARHIAGVTTRGKKCTSFAACRALIDAGEDIDYDGVSGPLELAPEGEPTMASFAHLVFGTDNAIDYERVTGLLAGDPARADPITPEPPPRDTAAPAEALRLGALFPLNGDLSFLGPSFSIGAELALDEVNAAGGVNGHEVVLVVRDTDDNASDLVFQSTDELLAAGVSVIIGAAASGTSLSVIDTIVSAGLVMFSPSNTATVFTSYEDRGLYFRTAPPDSMQGRALAERMIADGVSRLGIIARDDIYGQGLTEPLLREVQALGIAADDILTLTYTVPGELDAHVDALADFGPDGVVVIGFGESIEVFRLLNAAGIGPRREVEQN